MVICSEAVKTEHSQRKLWSEQRLPLRLLVSKLRAQGTAKRSFLLEQDSSVTELSFRICNASDFISPPGQSTTPNPISVDAVEPPQLPETLP